jgi:hypothetical protein
MICPRCAHKNPDAVAYCNACGQQINVAAPPTAVAETARWRQFVGPRADYYLERFRLFREGSLDRFVPTWHWPAFLVGWLWYLYRKMYLHAAVFLFGGLLPMFLGAGLVGVVVWNALGALAANYLYYMHVKLSLAMIERRAGEDDALHDRLITDAGGIQPYVWWLGVGLMALALAAGVMEGPSPGKPPMP